MTWFWTVLAALVARLVALSAAEFTDQCDNPPAQYMSLRFEYIRLDGSPRSEVVEGLSPPSTPNKSVTGQSARAFLSLR